jgi:hypothetical protein
LFYYNSISSYIKMIFSFRKSVQSMRRYLSARTSTTPKIYRDLFDGSTFQLVSNFGALFPFVGKHCNKIYYIAEYIEGGSPSYNSRDFLLAVYRWIFSPQG